MTEPGPYAHRSVVRGPDGRSWICRVCNLVTDTKPREDEAGCPTPRPDDTPGPGHGAEERAAGAASSKESAWYASLTEVLGEATERHIASIESSRLARPGGGAGYVSALEEECAAGRALTAASVGLVGTLSGRLLDVARVVALVESSPRLRSFPGMRDALRPLGERG